MGEGVAPAGDGHGGPHGIDPGAGHLSPGAAATIDGPTATTAAAGATMAP